jgi:hypothetical protein
MVIDYRRLNEVSEGEGYPIPNVKHMLHRLGSKRPKYFAVVDMVKGYHQVQLEEETKQFTAFLTPFGKFEWNRAPMGLKGLPSLFQCTMANEVLTGLVGDICELYIDDIIIYGNTEKEFIKNLEKVFQKLKEKGVQLSANKCILGVQEIEFVGHTINAQGLHFSKEKLAHVVEFNKPMVQGELKSFVGLANYFRDHVKNHSIICKPLEGLMNPYEPRKKIHWTEESSKAFEEI